MAEILTEAEIIAMRAYLTAYPPLVGPPAELACFDVERIAATLEHLLADRDAWKTEAEAVRLGAALILAEATQQEGAARGLAATVAELKEQVHSLANSVNGVKLKVDRLPAELFDRRRKQGPS